MSMSAKLFTSHDEAVKNRHFSCRHQTKEVHDYAREVHQNWERREVPEGARKRQVARQSRSAEEQYALLDLRLGKGVGARKERRKLLLLLGWSQQMIDLEYPLPLR